MAGDIIETRQKINAILTESFGAFLGVFFVVSVLIGLIDRIVKTGQAQSVLKEQEPNLKKIRQAIETDPSLGEDPIVKKLLELTKEVAAGSVDPRINEVIAAVKLKYEIK